MAETTVLDPETQLQTPPETPDETRAEDLADAAAPPAPVETQSSEDHADTGSLWADEGEGKETQAPAPEPDNSELQARIRQQEAATIQAHTANHRTRQERLTKAFEDGDLKAASDILNEEHADGTKVGAAFTAQRREQDRMVAGIKDGLGEKDFLDFVPQIRQFANEEDAASIVVSAALKKAMDIGRRGYVATKGLDPQELAALNRLGLPEFLKETVRRATARAERVAKAASSKPLPVSGSAGSNGTSNEDLYLDPNSDINEVKRRRDAERAAGG